jgi:methionyl-tRNA formyltransferase
MVKNNNIIFFGGKPISGRCLEILFKLHEKKQINIMGVIPRPMGEYGWWSKPGVKEVYEIAQDLGLPIIQQEECQNLSVDLGISVLYHRIIPPEIIRVFKNGIINFHPAPLPYYRGANAISYSIINGDTRFGSSLHFINEGVDKGDIIDVQWFDLNTSMSARVVLDLAEDLIEQMLIEWLDRIIQNNLPATPQSIICDRIGIKPHYYSRSSLDSIREISLDWSPERIWNYVRGLDFPPFEPAFSIINGKKIYLRCTYKDEGK